MLFASFCLSTTRRNVYTVADEYLDVAFCCLDQIDSTSAQQVNVQLMPEIR